MLQELSPNLLQMCHDIDHKVTKTLEKVFSELKKEAKFEFRTLRNPNVNYSFDNIHNNLYFTAQWNKGFAFSELSISRPGGNKIEIVWVRPEGDKISIISDSEILIHPLFVGYMNMWALIKDK